MSKCAAVKKRVAAITIIALASNAMTGTVAQTLSPSPVFEGNMTTPARNGAVQPVHVIVQTWEMGGPKGTAREIPLRGFFVAHLLSGAISTTIDGQTTSQPPGAYWTVKSGATMQVKVLSQFAVVETIVMAKQ